MDIQKGDRVLVNLAPFIGSPEPSRDWIPCNVISVDDDRIEVSPEYPCRELALWVEARWIRRAAEASHQAAGAFYA